MTGTPVSRCRRKTSPFRWLCALARGPRDGGELLPFSISRIRRCSGHLNAADRFEWPVQTTTAFSLAIPPPYQRDSREADKAPWASSCLCFLFGHCIPSMMTAACRISSNHCPSRRRCHPLMRMPASPGAAGRARLAASHAIMPRDGRQPLVVLTCLDCCAGQREGRPEIRSSVTATFDWLIQKMR